MRKGPIHMAPRASLTGGRLQTIVRLTRSAGQVVFREGANTLNRPDIFHKIKFYTVEIAATVAFVWIVGKALLHELGL